MLNHDQRDLLVPQFELTKKCLLDNFENCFFRKIIASIHAELLMLQMFHIELKRIFDKNLWNEFLLPLIRRRQKISFFCAINQSFIRIELEILFTCMCITFTFSCASFLPSTIMKSNLIFFGI